MGRNWLTSVKENDGNVPKKRDHVKKKEGNFQISNILVLGEYKFIRIYKFMSLLFFFEKTGFGGSWGPPNCEKLKLKIQGMEFSTKMFTICSCCSHFPHLKKQLKRI